MSESSGDNPASETLPVEDDLTGEYPVTESHSGCLSYVKSWDFFLVNFGITNITVIHLWRVFIQSDLQTS